jgi:hypothetical protein
MLLDTLKNSIIRHTPRSGCGKFYVVVNEECIDGIAQYTLHTGEKINSTELKLYYTVIVNPNGQLALKVIRELITLYGLASVLAEVGDIYGNKACVMNTRTPGEFLSTKALMISQVLNACCELAKQYDPIEVIDDIPMKPSVKDLRHIRSYVSVKDVI